MSPWTVACQASLSMGFSGQKYWSGLPFPSPGDLPSPGIKPRSPHCRQVLNHMSHQGSPLNYTLEKELYMTCTGTKIFLKHRKWSKDLSKQLFMKEEHITVKHKKRANATAIKVIQIKKQQGTVPSPIKLASI